MKTNITYRTDANVGAIGPSVWAKLGPEDWFTNYRLVAANSRNYDVPFVRNLGLKGDDLEKFTTQAIVETNEFKTIANGELQDYDFIVYRPVEPVEGIDAKRFIANDISYSRFEDKKVFRDTFQGILPIPEFVIIPMQEFLDTDREVLFVAYREKFDGTFVAQDNNSGGGRGTFIIKSIEDIDRARKVFSEEGKGEFVVISRFVRGIERSIQVFVSAEYILPGPLQQQLVRNTELLDPTARGGMYFCGGRFIFDSSEKVKQQVAKIVEDTAKTLRGFGYTGMFGIDFILDEDENVSTIEINARTTGILPLLNEQKSETPLYLLHILELSGESYTVDSGQAAVEAGGPQSFVTLFNQTGKKAYFDETISTGNYSFKDGSLVKLDGLARWNDQADVMLQLFASDEFSAKPNLKLTNIFLEGTGFDDDGQLSEKALEIVNYLKKHIITIDT